LVLQLLEQGADVSAQTTRPNSGTPLHEAVYQRHEAMVELLLQHGANPFVENNHSRTAMDLAITSGNVAVIRALENKAIFHGAPSS
jgi:ankyrin repeat protein